MKEKIAALFVHPSAYEYMQQIMEKEHITDISAYLTSYSELTALALQLEDEGVEVILARAGSAKLLRGILSVPVVSVDYTFGDFYRSVTEAMKCAEQHEILYIGLPYVLEKFEQFEQETGIFIRTMHGLRAADEYAPADLIDLEERLKKQKAQGVKVVLGGNPSLAIAKKIGLKAIYVTINGGEVLRAIREARYLLRLNQEQIKSINSMNHLFDVVRNGLISADEHGIITKINQEALSILDIPMVQRACGKSLDEIFPGMIERIQQQKWFDDIIAINGQHLSINVTSLQNSYEYLRYVVTLQKVDTIQNIDRNYRMKTIAKGHKAKYSFSDIIGESDAIHQCIEIAHAFSKTDHTVLLQGETGTGKELFAHSIHAASSRRTYPFVAINCAAIAENLMESELFGYVKGAFTGARSEGRSGMFELAHKGTVFLDEVSEIPLYIQTKLLRVLQEKEIMRLGDDQVIPLDIRVIAASNKDLKKEVAAGRFRQDLYYRLRVLVVRIPPLREREEDIILLFKHFLSKIGAYQLTHGAKAKLLELPWSGNVRELENMSVALSMICDGSTITADDIQKAMIDFDGIQLCTSESIADIEQQQILRVLEQTNGNKKEAANILGISTATLWRRLKLYAENDD